MVAFQSGGVSVPGQVYQLSQTVSCRSIKDVIADPMSWKWDIVIAPCV